MLADGGGLFRVAEKSRTARERKILEKHPWRGRLESLLRQAGEHGADWVYFRLVCDAGGPKPEVYVFDRSRSLSDSDATFDIARLQLELWNYGRVPLAFVLRPLGVEIYNLLEPPAFGPDGLKAPKVLEKLQFSPSAILAKAGKVAKAVADSADDAKWDRFSGPRFDNGSFWEDPKNRDLGRSERSSMAAMVKEMQIVRKSLESRMGKLADLPEDFLAHVPGFVRRLLILTLMVRFLEERDIIPPDYFFAESKDGDTGFRALLRQPKRLLKALDRLAADFNGDIFKISDSTGDVPLRAMLRQLADHEEALAPISDFAEGRMEGEQRHFWERYSFRHLPVEAISYVYEDFLGGKSQSYFTPHHLVDLLLDEAMPAATVREVFETQQGEPTFPVLDPSCGSGVFLVGAWQRLVEAYRLIEPEPTPEQLKRLLEINIHGIDLESDSVELTVFSLCVALCGTFPVKSADPEFSLRKLKELKFPNLKSTARERRNIDCGDFFKRRAVLMASPLRFRAIVGNPPFQSSLTDEARALDAERTDEYGKEWVPVPDDNIAYLFLRAVPPLLAPGGRACLVQNAGLLYNEKPAAFRESLFGNWQVPAVFDFASISGLFRTRKPGKKGRADSDTPVGVKTVAVVVDRREPDAERPVLHVTFRRTAALDEREVFEVDPQDFHWVPKKVAAKEPRVWKANLLGGGRLFQLYRSLTSGRTVQAFVAEQEKKRKWVSGEGVIAANVDTYGKSAEGAKGRYTPQRRPGYKKIDFIETSGLEGDSIDFSRVKKCDIEWFLWPRDEDLFCPPHLLIKEHESFPMVLRLSGKKLLFRDKIVGFSAPDTPADREELQKLHRFLKGNREAAQFFAAFGPQYLIFRMGTPLKKSLMDLPYPENGTVLFQGVQKHLRDDVLEFMIPLIKDNQHARAELADDAKPVTIKGYSKVFRSVMASAFPDLQISGDPIDLGRAWCVSFHRGDSRPVSFGSPDEAREFLDALLVKQMGRSLRCHRIVRHFHGRSLFIIKPKPKRYWLKSAAIRDADEMFAWWASQVSEGAKKGSIAKE